MRLLILTVLFLFPNLLYSRQLVAGKGERLFYKGQDCLKKNRSNAAARYFERSIASNPCYADAYMALGTLYSGQGKHGNAAQVYRRALNTCPSKAATMALPFASALFRAQQYNEAEQILQRWYKGNTASVAYERLLQNIQFARQLPVGEPAATPQNMGSRINSKYDEYFPSISRNDSTLVFTRKTNGIDEDFYIAQRDSCGGWFVARDMGSPPNSSEQEGAQMISADGHYLFFMRCGNRSPNGWEAGGCDLYFSYTEREGWSQPVPFGATINTPGYEGMPSLSSDNKELFFVSSREGGYGGNDIWVSRFENGLWQVPENLGPEINTAFDETAPFIAADNKTLYFTSDGHPGLGGHDLFLSRKESGHWQKPQNMGTAVNSPDDDVSICVAPDGKKAYFASNRPGGEGGMDVYEVVLQEQQRPESYTYVYGVVYDSITRERLNYAQIEWYDAATGQLLYHFQSNRGDASYMASVVLDKQYAVHVYRPGYADQDDTLRYTDMHIVSPDTLHFALLNFNYSPPLEDTLLLRLHFVTNVTGINDSAKAIIREQVSAYIHQPDIVFFVNGYTDDTGTPHINEALSFSRAREVAQVLFSLGLSDEQMHVQGWADAEPIMPNDTEMNRFLNRRVEIIVRKPK